MKSGIIRSIDDLGRIVIPKEIRRTLQIREGDPLEIYVTGSSIELKKYNILQTLDSVSEQYLQVFSKTYGGTCAICSNDNVLKSRGITLSVEVPLSDAVKTHIQSMEPYLYDEQNLLYLFADQFPIDALFPIGADRSTAGAFILLRNGNTTKEHLACASMLTDILTELITKE